MFKQLLVTTLSVIALSGCITTSNSLNGSNSHQVMPFDSNMPSWVIFVRFEQPQKTQRITLDHSSDPSINNNNDSATSYSVSTPRAVVAEVKGKTANTSYSSQAYTPGVNKLPSSSLNDEQWLYSKNPDHYTVQLVTMQKDSSVQRHLSDVNAPTAKRYAILLNNKLLHFAVIGDYASLESANLASSNYGGSAVRKFSAIQNSRCRTAKRMPATLASQILDRCS